MDIKYFKFIKDAKIPTHYGDDEVEHTVVRIVADSDQFIPANHHTTDAGADIKSSIDITLQPNKVEMVDAGFSAEIPDGYHAKIVARSSMGKRGILVPNSPGIIDSSYRGRICVLLLNLSGQPYEIKKGDRIAQWLLDKNQLYCWESVEKLSETERGTGGFGSSGT